MKTRIFTVFFLVISINLFAQSNYESAIVQNLEALNDAKSLEDMQEIANKFERIAMAETDKWIPRYYASYINVILSFKTQDVEQKQKYLDYAQQQLDEAIKIDEKESELYTLQGLLYQAYITIDPVNNGRVYSVKANGSFGTAKGLNSKNPRPYYLEALTVMNTPEQFGGGKKVAQPMLEHASALFSSFKPSDNLMPDWGKEDCDAQLQACKNRVE